ncbi:FUSC family protein [Zhihengliuella halotolerans]|uniref:Fusaric acid resistance family protein n=1 Tax=Zhihengliuella halotolerans TaxID=370736 RepID=A0A4Q8AIV2_9MICC|nr:FUSC family protein [Zhihengliuella halotolerans]RZU63689.1 fusaric acid resistance family protein [Zhihengliuella halotolerans]
MYGRGQPPAVRLRQQGWAALRLGLAIATGLALNAGGAPLWGIALCSVAFAAFASWAAERVGLSPSGPFFGIFALGTFATLPPGEADVRYALVIYGATAALCLLVGQLSRVNILGARRILPAPGVARGVDAAAARRRALGYAVAVAAASAIALLLGIAHVGWAAAGATIPLAASTLRAQAFRGAECVVGTLLGIVLAGMVLVPELSATAQAILVMWLLFPTEALMARNYGLALGFFTPLVLLMTDLTGPAEPFSLLLDRLAGAVVGAAVGVAIAWLFARTARTCRSGGGRSDAD